MKKDIIINATSSEIRVAITEDERLAEIFLEVPDKERHVGSIYLGRVERVVQGMNAAFIDIGEPQDAFLHFSDVGSALDEFKDLLDDKDDEDDDEDDETPAAAPAPKPVAGKEPRTESPRKEKDDRRKSDKADDGDEAAPPGDARAKRPNDRRKPDRRRDGRTEPIHEADPRTPSAQEEDAPTPETPENRDRDRKRPDGRNRRPERDRRPARGPGDDQAEPRPRHPEPEAREPEHDREDDIDTDLPLEEGASGEDMGTEDQEGRKRRRKRGRRGGRGRNRKREDGSPAEGEGGTDDSAGASEAPAGEKTPEPPRERRPERNDRDDRRRQPDNRGGSGTPATPRPAPADRSGDANRPDRREPRKTIEGEPPAVSDQAPRTEEPRQDRDRRGGRDRHGRDRHGRDRRRDDRRRDDTTTPREGQEAPRDAQENPEQRDRRIPAAPEGNARRGDRPAPPRPADTDSTGAASPSPEQPRENPKGRPNRTDQPRDRRRTEEREGSRERRAEAPPPPLEFSPAAPPADDTARPEPAAKPETPARGARRGRPAPARSKTDENIAPKEAPEPRKARTKPESDAPAPEAGTTPPGKKPSAPKRERPPRGGRKRGGDDDTPAKGSTTMDAKLPTFQTKRSGEVTIALEKGKDVIVQVTRESYASKGVRVTTKVSLPGRFLVLLPLDPAIGISRKVQNMKERRRLRRIAKSILPEGHGCIIRTVAQDKDEEVIRQDLTKLIEAWREIEQKIKQTDKPGLLYKDLSIANTVMRDLFTLDTNRVVIDNKALYKEIRDYVEWAAPSLVKKVELYTGTRPIFDQYGMEKELQKVAERKVYIPSGGYIILDQTEAMMVIDVNSGRYAGKKDQELNSLRTNLESAREIARQIRLRDIGGLIVVDFIDLYDEKNRKKVYDEMKKEMKKDRAKSVVLPMTQFGLVQMTRQRIRQQVVQTISEPCPICSGSGLVQSKSTVVRNIERWLQRFREGSREFRLTLTANPIIIDYLTEGEMSRLTMMMLKHFVRIKVIPDDSLTVDDFQFYSVRTGADVTGRFVEESSNGAKKREKEKERVRESSRKPKEVAAGPAVNGQ